MNDNDQWSRDYERGRKQHSSMGRYPRLNKMVFLYVAEGIKRSLHKTLSQDEVNGIELVAHELCEAFASGNSKFDKELFLKNCGVKS